MSEERTGALLEQWLALAGRGGDFIASLQAFISPVTRIYLQNGTMGDGSAVGVQMAAANLLFVELDLQVDHACVLSDRIAMQVSLTGRGLPVYQERMSDGARMRSFGLVVLRANEHEQFTDVWPYLNPGAAITFPLAPGALDVPVPEGIGGTGTPAQVQALFEAWTVALEQGDLVAAVRAVADLECVVLATNGAVGDIEMFEEHCAVMEAAYADLAMEVEGVVIGPDRVYVQLLLSGRHVGRLGPWEATGRDLRVRGA
ncbi:MAG: hypothetical protein O2798_09225, partial [Chloroflexi bacterium]|nr:hypothetical protein [Chloroflexota bacterium]